MPNALIEFSQAILKLNKEKQYEASLKYFKENKAQFTQEQIGSNEFLISGILTALRKTENFDNAFKFLNIYKIEITENAKEIILTNYGWLLYFKFKSECRPRENHSNESQFFDEEEFVTENANYQFNKSEIISRIENFIPLILTINNEFSYTLLSNLFILVMKEEKKKPNANWSFINSFCDLIPSERLKTDCRSEEKEIKGAKKLIEYASDRENWFAYKSKALMKLSRFQDCYDISTLGLETLEKLHYSNEIWFARRIALSKKNLGNSSDAIKELLQVLKKKNQWFIQKELAELYKETGEFENAFKFAINAINNFGELEYKIDLLFLLGELLKEKKEIDISFKHFSLSRLIRISEEWNIPQKLSTALSKFEREDIPIEKVKELKIELRKYWETFNTKGNGNINNQKLLGVIDKILHNDEKGVDGFIKYDRSKSIYFRLNSSEAIKSKIRLGANIKFKILPRKDEKKEKAIILEII